MTYEKVYCAWCGEKVAKHEAWPLGEDRWACSLECERKAGEVKPLPEALNECGNQIYLLLNLNRIFDNLFGPVPKVKRI